MRDRSSTDFGEAPRRFGRSVSRTSIPVVWAPSEHQNQLVYVRISRHSPRSTSWTPGPLLTTDTISLVERQKVGVDRIVLPVHSERRSGPSSLLLYGPTKVHYCPSSDPVDSFRLLGTPNLTPSSPSSPDLPVGPFSFDETRGFGTSRLDPARPPPCFTSCVPHYFME